MKSTKMYPFALAQQFKNKHQHLTDQQNLADYFYVKSFLKTFCWKVYKWLQTIHYHVLLRHQGQCNFWPLLTCIIHTKFSFIRNKDETEFHANKIKKASEC